MKRAIITMSLHHQRRSEFLRKVWFLGIMLLIWNLQLDAATVNWASTGTGATGQNWNGNKTNWSPNCSTANLCNNLLSGKDVVIDGSKGATQTVSNDTYSTLSFNTLSIGAGFTVTSSGGNTLTLSSAGSSNAGTINWNGTLNINGSLNNAGGTLGASTGTINNNSTITGGTILNTITNNGMISGATYGNSATAATINGGAISGSSSGINAVFAGVTNSGTLTANTAGGGSVLFNGGTNSGTLTAGTGALKLAGTIANSGGVINGRTNGATLQSGAQINNGTIQGNVNGSGGDFNNTQFQNASITGGAISGSGNTATGANSFSAVSIQSGATLAINGGTSTFTGSSASSGTVDIGSSGSAVISGTPAGGTVDTAGSLTISGNLGTGVSPVDFEEDSGSVSLSGTLQVSTANLLGGTISGTGTFDGGTVNNGSSSDSSAGVTLTENGSSGLRYNFNNYNQHQGGVFAINIGAPGADELVVANSVNLAGTLELFDASGNPFGFGTPANSVSYVLIADLGGLVSGAFNTIKAGTSSLASLPTGWSLVYNGASSPIAGGDVELDYTVQHTDPSSAPEPGTEMLVGGGLLAAALLRKRISK